MPRYQFEAEVHPADDTPVIAYGDVTAANPDRAESLVIRAIQDEAARDGQPEPMVGEVRVRKA
jgi:hypothetical protein